MKRRERIVVRPVRDSLEVVVGPREGREEGGLVREPRELRRV